MIGEDWKGFNTACYKKDNQVGKNRLQEVGLNSDSESEIRTSGRQNLDLIQRNIASPLRASTMRRR